MFNKTKRRNFILQGQRRGWAGASLNDCDYVWLVSVFDEPSVTWSQCNLQQRVYFHLVPSGSGPLFTLTHRCQSVVSYSLDYAPPLIAPTYVDTTWNVGRINTQLSVTSNVFWHENGEITISISWPPSNASRLFHDVFELKINLFCWFKFPMTQLFVYCILAVVG